MIEDASPAGKRTRRLVGLFVVVALLSLGLDALSKEIVLNELVRGEPVRLLGGALYLSLTFNSGAAFSLASDFTVVLTIFAAATVVAICWYAFRKLGSLPWAIALGMVCGGAAGNLMDRLFRPPGFMTGHVVDFLSLFHPSGGYFAIFNIADMSLVMGVILVVWLELFGRRIDGTRTMKNKQDESSES